MPIDSATVNSTWSIAVAVPDAFEDRVAEAEDEDVLHRLLAQVMVDAEDLFLLEMPVDRRPKFACELARSRPNGFSTTSRVPGTRPASSSALMVEPKTEGGIDR